MFSLQSSQSLTKAPLYFVLCDYAPKVGRAYVETIFAGPR